MKAILVIDMPDCCDECHLKVESVHCYDACCITGSKIISSYGKFPWCPLKPMPEKVEILTDKKSCDIMDWYDLGTKRGYNACIDKIMGE